jgi:hypothetical protein
MPQKTADQDFGLLQAIDERLAMYGWLTNTGVKFVTVVDMEGRQATANDPKANATIGLRDSDLKPVCYSPKLMQKVCLYTWEGIQGIARCIHQLAQRSILPDGQELASHSRHSSLTRF